MGLTMTTTEARAALHDLLERVELGDEVTITRHGRPVAVVVRPDALRARRADGAMSDAAALRRRLAAARDQPLADAPTLGADRADDLVDEVRAGRAAR